MQSKKHKNLEFATWSIIQGPAVPSTQHVLRPTWCGIVLHYLASILRIHGIESRSAPFFLVLNSFFQVDFQEMGSRKKIRIHIWTKAAVSTFLSSELVKVKSRLSCTLPYLLFLRMYFTLHKFWDFHDQFFTKRTVEVVYLHQKLGGAWTVLSAAKPTSEANLDQKKDSPNQFLFGVPLLIWLINCCSTK